ncbi:hypothetical protein OG792_33505 [Micromonospora sp. NBC_01699]|uniref:hypothetical protein n=1 Tax=Micromonospora sp. NBC_01699 TaxID=2975984 RepID=UPI002E29DCCB|nr:hypothetical protein [Micromonospora sp. NBC_01699]
MASDAQTDPNPYPSAAEAAAALRRVRETQSALGRRMAPSWYFSTLAALLGAITLSQLLPTPATILVTLTLVAAMAAMARAFLDRAGVVPLTGTVTVRGIVLSATPLVLVMLAAVWLDDSGHHWAWIVAAAVNAGAVLSLGWWHRRRLRADA